MLYLVCLKRRAEAKKSTYNHTKESKLQHYRPCFRYIWYMNTVDTEMAANKLKLMQLLLETDDTSKVELAMAIFSQEENGVERISVEQYNKELDDSIAQVSAGKVTSQVDLEKEMEGW